MVVPYAGKPILKRKVLRYATAILSSKKWNVILISISHVRKYNGESYVFDESATESEAGKWQTVINTL